MIQRIQSLWLLIAATIAGLIYVLPLWSGILPNGDIKKLWAAESLLFLTLDSLVFIIALFGIFLYKKRGTQKLICVLGILISIGLVALEYFAIADYKKEFSFNQGTWELAAMFPLLQIVFFFLAYRGISKDQALLKEGDRLR